MGFDARGRKLNEVCSEMRESDSRCSLDRWRTWLQLKLPESLDRMCRLREVHAGARSGSSYPAATS